MDARCLQGNRSDRLSEIEVINCFREYNIYTKKIEIEEEIVREAVRGD